MDSKRAGKGLKSDWETPLISFEPVNEVMKFKIDVAANEKNTKCINFIDESQDAFKTDWEPDPFFLNFPWGNEYRKKTGITPLDWIKRALYQVSSGLEGAVLCPASVNSIWWNLGASRADYILFPLGRVKYEHESLKRSSAPNFESSWMIFRPFKFTKTEVRDLSDVGLLLKRA